MMKPKLTVQSTDRGFARLRRDIRKLTGAAVDTGFFDGSDVITRARANEFGTVNIPARPFLGTAFEEHEDELLGTMEKVLAAMASGKISVRRGLSIIGLKSQAIVRKRIVEIDSPPNAPATIARKGSSNPLVDTSQMVREVDYRVTEK